MVEYRERKLNRWLGYDYSQIGQYFITICTHNKEMVFGDVINGKMVLNEYGKIAKKCWQQIPQHYLNIQIDIFVVMPNHLHGIIMIDDPVGTGQCPVPTMRYGLLSKIVNSFKNVVTKQIRSRDFHFQWQRSFHDRVIRNQWEYQKIYQYIKNNPKNWGKDRNNRG
ncbi:MAG: transposase [Patescibacteria group bacterium]